MSLEIKGTHPFTSSWIFDSVDDRDLADVMAIIADQNKVEINDFRYIFQHTLRMLKSASEWAN